jgi:hypothetical protein
MLDEVELARPMGNHASLKPRRRHRKGKKLQARGVNRGGLLGQRATGGTQYPCRKATAFGG